MYKVYAIKSLKDGRIYVGISKNVNKRLKSHNYGQVKSTKPFKPWKIIFIDNKFYPINIARKREKYYKSGCGKEFLKTNIPPACRQAGSKRQHNIIVS